MKKLSLFIFSALLLTACSSAEVAMEEGTNSAVDMEVEVVEESSVEADLQESADMWQEVLDEREGQDFDLAVLRMKAVYAKANYHVFNGNTSQEVADFMGELDGLLDAAEAGEFEEDFFYSALEEGLLEFQALL